MTKFLCFFIIAFISIAHNCFGNGSFTIPQQVAWGTGSTVFVDTASDTLSIRLIPECLIQPEDFKNPVGLQWQYSGPSPVSYSFLPWITINPGYIFSGQS